MQKIFENWNKFLKEHEEDLSDPRVNPPELSEPTVKLHHFCGRLCWRSPTPDSVVLDPQKGLDKPQSYSRREYEASRVPRVFFYLDPAQRESIVKGPLYTVEVSTSDIYNLLKDEKEFSLKVREDRQAENSRFWHGTVDSPLRRGDDINTFLRLIIADGYKGAYYYTGGFKAVAWFEPIEVTLEKQEEK